MYFELTEREAHDLQAVCALARYGAIVIKRRSSGDAGFCDYIDSVVKVARQVNDNIALGLEGEDHG